MMSNIYKGVKTALPAVFIILGVTAADFPFVETAHGQTVTVPAGTHLMVQMTTAVNSRQHGVGHRFTAQLEGDLVANDGTVVAPHGSQVYGRLAQARQAGRLVGRSELTLELNQILINNQRKPILTSAVQALERRPLHEHNHLQLSCLMTPHFASPFHTY